MSFWNTSDNKSIENTGEYEAGGGDIEPIPAKTQVKAACEEAKWDEYDGDRYISLRWTVLAPDEYKNRKIFQKIRVNDTNPDKSDKAKRMLAAIAVNAGGGLMKINGEPTDVDLQNNLVMKPMALLLQVWRIDKERDGTPIAKADQKSGNWISAVSPLKKKQAAAKPETMAEIIGSDEDELGF